jgi:hypothetical protein
MVAGNFAVFYRLDVEIALVYTVFLWVLERKTSGKVLLKPGR